MRLGIALGLANWPSYGSGAGAIVEPPPGDQWIAGERMWQDTSATIPADTEGDAILSWTTLAGRKLTVVGAVPMRAMSVQGTLTPCNGPTSGAFWLSDDQFDIRSLDLHMVLSHTASVQFGAGVTGRLWEIQGYNAGILAYDNSTVATVSPARFATRVPKTMLGLTSDASGLRVWRDGVVKTPASGRPSTSNKNIAIGDIDSTGGTVPTYACAYQRIFLGLSTDRTAILAEHATYAALPSRPWCITYTDSMGVVVADAAYYQGWSPNDGLNRRLNETYNVVGISRSGGVIADVNTTGMFNATKEEIGVGVSSAPDDGRLLLFFVTNDLNVGNATSYEASVTARADAYVAAFAFNADQIVIVIPPYRYAPWDATVYNAQVDILAGLLATSDYIVVDLRAVATSANGGIHTDGVHMTDSGLTAVLAAILAAV